ncbi:MAG: KH domain-containing protein, partial [Victivallales bacterium]|nr:KH domain-containing protein [Victivallales bacterium]
MTEQERKELAKKNLDKMTEMLGYGATSTVLPGEHDNFKLSLASEDAGRIIGRKGQALEALELLLNRILKKNDEDTP